MTEAVNGDLTSLKGVGPQLDGRLGKLGIHHVHDLLFHLPIRYEDRTRLQEIGAVTPGAPALIEGVIEHSAIVRGRRAMLVVMVSDGTGRISLRFFHFRAHQKQQLARGARIRCFGEVRAGYQGLEMVHPSYTKFLPGQEPPLATSAVETSLRQVPFSIKLRSVGNFPAAHHFSIRSISAASIAIAIT